MTAEATTSSPSRRRTKPTLFAPWFIAAPLDFICIVAFVLGGKESHNINEGFTWIFDVVAPLTIGFFIPALAVQLYRKADNRWVRLMVAIGAGVILWGAIRFLFFDRLFLSVSNLVAAAFLLVTMGGWRLVALGLQRRSARS